MRLLKNAKIAVLLPLIIVASACDDLVLEPHSAVSNDAYFKQIGDYEAAIIGVYDQISIADYYGRSLYLMADIMGEDVKQNGSANRYQEFADFEGQIVTGHGFEQELWAEGYEGINMLNMIIQAEFDGPTSVENLCHKLFTEITQMGFRLAKLEVQETDTSIVSYTREDWVADNRYFGKQSLASPNAEAAASN